MLLSSFLFYCELISAVTADMSLLPPLLLILTEMESLKFSLEPMLDFCTLFRMMVIIHLSNS